MRDVYNKEPFSSNVSVNIRPGTAHQRMKLSLFVATQHAGSALASCLALGTLLCILDVAKGWQGAHLGCVLTRRACPVGNQGGRAVCDIGEVQHVAGQRHVYRTCFWGRLSHFPIRSREQITTVDRFSRFLPLLPQTFKSEPLGRLPEPIKLTIINLYP